MSDLVNLGFRADTRGLLGAQRELDRTTAAGGRLDRAAVSLGKSIAAIATGMLAVTGAGAVKDTIFNFDNALKGLQATSRASTKDMAALEKQARTLGATSKFSATQAAEAQRFLAMAGFDTNKILSSTPGILKLATAGELSLAEAADIASNALGGLQLSVDHLDRVIDVMAEASASANTDIRQLAVAFRNAAPIATAAGVELEELSAIIGSLSDSGVQAERAGTGVLGIIRQLSNVSDDAERTLNNYGVRIDQVSIKQHGLTGVMKTLRDAGLSSGDAIKVFGSDAATAGLITAAFSDHVANMTEKYKNAAGAAKEMADIMAGSLTAGALGLGSAMSELALQIGDAGFSGAMKEGMLATTGFLHVFTGMLPEFAEANNLTAEYTTQLESFADIATITAGALGGMVAAMVVAKVATVGLTGVMSVLNVVMLANPAALVVASLAALTGGLYAARNMTVEFGDETIKVMDAIYGGFEVWKDGFDAVADAALGAYDYISGVFKDIAGESVASASVTSDGFATAFNDIYNLSKSFSNAVIATFVSLGKAIGIVAATIYIGFRDSFQNVQLIGEAFWKDFTGIFSGEAGLDNMTKALKKALVDPMAGAMLAIKEETVKAFATDYIGDAAVSLESSLGGIIDKFNAYTLAARDAREENERLAKELDMFSTFTETMNVPDWISKGSPITPVVETSGAIDNIDELIAKVDDFGGSWTRSGSAMIDAFGSAADVLSEYASKMEDIGKLQAELNKKREEYKDGTQQAIKIDASLAKLQSESSSAQIGALGKTIGLSASLFKENSKERKALHALEMGFMAVEIALAAEKALVAAVGAVANQGSGDPYTAFGRIAAMIGIMAGVLGAAGIAFSGGGSGGGYTAPSGGTGTTLGDSEAQSASLTNAFDKLEDIELDQLSELRGIRSSMQSLNNGIANLAKSFVTGLDFSDSGYAGQLGTSTKGIADVIGISMPSLIEKMPSFIDPILSFFVGGFSSKKKELLDSGITFVSQTFADIFNSGQLDASVFQVIETTKKKFWGLSKKTSTNTEFSSIDDAILEQMGSIFGFIGESVIGAVESLGLEASHIIHTGIGALGLEDALAGFQIDIGDVSFKDKTGDEIQKELEAIFSQQADLIAKYLVPSIAEYQQMGEGAFETLQRVAYEQAVFNDSLERTGMSLSNLSALMQIDVAQSIIGMIGGIEKFSELSNSFFGAFYSESDQLAYMERSIANVFDSLNLSIVGTREEFKSLVNGLDLTKEADQALYAALLELSPVMDEYLGALDDLANEKLSLQIELLNAQGKSLEALALKRQMELDSTDESLHAILKQIWALDDAARAEKERTAELEAAQRLQDQYTGLRIRLLNEMGMSEEALSMSREIELSKLDESLHAMMRQIWAQQDLNAERDKEIAALNEMKLTLENNVKFAEQQLEKARQAEIGRINATVTKAQEAYDFEIQSINKQREAYNAFITELESKVSAAESSLNASLSAELSKYDKLIEAVNYKANAEIEALNDVSSARLSALNDERGIVASIASELGKASKSFTAAQALNAARRGDFNPAGNIALGDGYTDEISARVGQGREAFALNEIGKLADAQLSDLDRTIAATEGATERQIAAINDAAQKEVEQLEAQKLAIEEQVKAALGIDDSVLALDVALAQYQAAQDELQKALAENTLEKLQAQEDVALAAFEQAKSDAQEQIDALNEQVDALLNIDNSVVSVQAAIELLLSERKELDNLHYDAELAQIELLHALNTTASLLLAKPNTLPDFGPIKDLFDPIMKKQPIDTTWPIMNPIDELAKEVKQSNEASNEARQVADSANRAIAKNTASTAKILQRLEINNESRSVL